MQWLCMISLFLLQQTLNAQGLHEIKCTANGTAGADTYLEDINDLGLIAGYYNSGQNKGFVISKTGLFTEVNASVLNPAITQTRVVGINNHNVVAIQGQTASGYEMVKGYYNTWAEDFNLQTITNNGQPNLARNTKVNNLNDFVGWYQGTTSRWLYISHDSIVPSPPAWKAHRYTVGPDFYNTIAGGMNDNGIVVGYYIDGSLNIPFLFNSNTATFTLINTTLNMKVYDINNSNTIVGEYRQANNIWMAFKADLDIVNGNLISFTSLDNHFENNTIASYAKGINNHGTIVGSYYHPVTNQYTGFVYFPQAIDSFTLHSLNYGQDVFRQIRNKGTGPETMWPPDVYAGIDYYTQDPYVPAAGPLIDDFIRNLHTRYNNPNAVPPRSSPLWKVFAELIDTANVALSSDPYLIDKYKTIYKYRYFLKWQTSVFERGWAGMCYGFTSAALRKKYDNSTYSTVYNLNPSQDIGDMDNTELNAITSIQAEFIKQLDVEHNRFISRFNAVYDSMCPYQAGIYYLKYHYTAPFNLANPRGLHPGLGHSILPYKIKGPQKWPFDVPVIKEDTLYLYENAEPQNNNIFATFRYKFVNKWDSNFDLVNWQGHYQASAAAYFYVPGVRDPAMSKTKIITLNKKTRSQTPDTLYALHPGHRNHYELLSGTSQASWINGTVNYSASGNWKPVFLKDSTRKHPIHWNHDSATAIHIKSFQYSDSSMNWNLSSQHLTMGINRLALPAETDFGSVLNKTITYGNPDNLDKTLSCYSILHDDGMNKGMNVLVHNLNLGFQDSIRFETKTDYQVEIQNIQGGPTSYDLWVFSDNGDSIRQFITQNIPLTANTKHTIEPYYPVAGGWQTVVYVDSGMNGNTDDTLFLPNVPLGIRQQALQQFAIKIYPNPASDQVNIHLDGSAPAQFNLQWIDIRGQIVQSEILNFTPGQADYTFNLRGLTPGLYQLRVKEINGQWQHVQKLTIQ